MSSQTHHHHNQVQHLHNHYTEYEFHSGLMQTRDHILHPSEYHQHDGEMDGQSSLLPDAIIRGNMQYVNGELRKIPRPLNAFMIFSNEKRKELKKEFPGEPNNMISSRLGAAWKGLSDEARKKYHDMAHREDLEHRRKFPNYQYCPGHARKLKKARREQRLRQQGAYRGTRNPARGPHSTQGPPSTRKRTTMEIGKQKSAASTAGGGSKQEANDGVPIKRESSADRSLSPIPSTSARRSSTTASAVAHGMGGGTCGTPVMSGQYGAAGFAPQSEGSAECMLSCCNGCKPADIYCCPDSHWNTDALAASHGFTPAPYPPPMFYFTPGYEAQYSGEAMVPQPCLMSGDCNGCYPGATYMDGCYAPLYPAAGDGNMIYKDLCFIPADSPMTSSPNTITPLTSVGPMGIPSNDCDTELTDISNNMVASVSHDSQTSSQRSCGSKESYSASPSTLHDISPPSAAMCSAELPEISDD